MLANTVWKHIYSLPICNTDRPFLGDRVLPIFIPLVLTHLSSDMATLEAEQSNLKVGVIKSKFENITSVWIIFSE